MAGGRRVGKEEGSKGVGASTSVRFSGVGLFSRCWLWFSQPAVCHAHTLFLTDAKVFMRACCSVHLSDQPPGVHAQLTDGWTTFRTQTRRLGYRVVVPSDGSGQVLLVPPGEKVPGEEGAAAGEPQAVESSGRAVWCCACVHLWGSLLSRSAGGWRGRQMEGPHPIPSFDRCPEMAGDWGGCAPQSNAMLHGPLYLEAGQ